MLGVAVRVVPLPRVGQAAALVVVLVELVRWDCWVLWPLQGTAVGLLGAAAAWCFDEDAAAIADTAPRGPAWRAAARAPAVLLLVTTWTAVVLHAGDRALFGHRDAVLVQGLAAVAAGAALALWRRSRGEATPGLRIATAVVPVATAWALVRPAAGQLPVFPYGTSSTADWTASATGWVVLAVVAVAAAALVLAEVRRPARAVPAPRRPRAGRAPTRRPRPGRRRPPAG